MRTPKLAWIRPEDPPEAFPDPALALRDPDGLLAVGGDLSPGRLLHAYRCGIFPWYQGDQPILWWSPDPRAVLFPGEFHLSRSLRKRLRGGGFEFTFDVCFADVMAACSGARTNQPGGGTWITPAMCSAYLALHERGHAHSVEVWSDGNLIGGVYGVTLGGVFFGESMFSRVTDGSKAALACLSRSLPAWGYGLIDCQVMSAHLLRLGARPLPRAAFLTLLERLCSQTPAPDAWRGGAKSGIE